MKILIGYDGSTYADAAIDDLRLAGLPPSGEALVVSVGDVLFTPPLASHELVEKIVASRRVTSAIELAQEHEVQAIGEAHRLVKQAAERVKKALPGWDVLPKALAGAPAQELLREAQFWDADLILVGSRGLSALGRFFLGSVSATVASEAHCAVRIVRRARAKSKMSAPPRLMVGVDGSSGAAKAVRAIRMREWPEGTEVRLIAVDDGSEPVRIKDIPVRLEEMMDGNETPPVNARLMLEGARMILSEEGVNVSAEVIEGDPQRVLIDEARKWKADSLFVGARGMESEEGSGLGRVAHKLVTGAHCSVELVR